MASSSCFYEWLKIFFIACQLEEAYTNLCELLDKNWQVPMSRYGMMKHLNGIDIS
jgi:hypothetical protein